MLQAQWQLFSFLFHNSDGIICGVRFDDFLSFIIYIYIYTFILRLLVLLPLTFNSHLSAIQGVPIGLVMTDVGHLRSNTSLSRSAVEGLAGLDIKSFEAPPSEAVFGELVVTKEHLCWLCLFLDGQYELPKLTRTLPHTSFLAVVLSCGTFL